MYSHLRLLTAAAALCFSVATMGNAGMFDNLSPEDRAALRDEIRSYLLENPAVLFEAVDIYEEQQRSAQLNQDEDLIRANYQDIFNDGQSLVLGNPDGDVLLVEFTDYKCSFCKKALMAVAGLIERDPQVGVIIKELPVLGQESVVAARFAVAARRVNPDLYPILHQRIMSFSGPLNETSLGRIAQDVGYDLDAVKAEEANPEVMQHLQETRLLAERLGIQGTPGFVTPNRVLRGYLEDAQMAAVVAELRAAP